MQIDFERLLLLSAKIVADIDANDVAHVRMLTPKDLEELVEEVSHGQLSDSPDGLHHFGGATDLLSLLPALLGIIKTVVDWTSESKRLERKSRSEDSLRYHLVAAGIPDDVAARIAREYVEDLRSIDEIGKR